MNSSENEFGSNDSRFIFSTRRIDTQKTLSFYIYTCALLHQSCIMKETGEQIEICQACFALNNIGVTLVENGHFREASKTLKAAVSALKHFIFQPNLTDGLSARANQLLKAELTVASSRAAQNQTAVETGIDIVSMEERDNCAFQAAQQYGPSGSVIFPIRFRDLPTYETLQEGDLPFQASVIVYNYGVARLMMYRTTTDTIKRESNLREAHKMFSMAKGLVAKNICEADLNRRIAFGNLLSLILANLSTVYRFQDRTDKVMRVHQLLIRLQDQQEHLERRSPYLGSYQGAAAAAA